MESIAMEEELKIAIEELKDIIDATEAILLNSKGVSRHQVRKWLKVVRSLIISKLRFERVSEILESEKALVGVEHASGEKEFFQE
jgi:hypothetical protein